VCGRDRSRATAEVGRVFGDDLIEVRMTEPMDDMSSDSYCFVRCDGYHPHIGDLISSTVVRAVLPSYEQPQPLSDVEVDAFFESFEKPGSAELSRGDLVQVVDGYLSGLFGLVVGPGRRKRWRVQFKFYVRKFVEEMYPSQVKVVDNVFRRLKSPVTSATLSRDGLRVMEEMMGRLDFKEYMAERRGLHKIRGSKS
jgi:transcription antitermination factor NusG